MEKVVLSTALAACVILAGCASTGEKAVATATPQASVQTCKAVSEAEIAALFDRWNQSLQTGDAKTVVKNYAARSILLPTVSNQPHLTAAEKQDYFEHFLQNQPVGSIDMRFVELGCNTAFDAGLYTFKFAKTGTKVSGRYTFTYGWDGKQWLITSHHSSAMPEAR